MGGAEIVIDVREDGCAASPGGEQQFVAEHQGRRVYRGRLPVYGTARALLAEGVPSDTIMRTQSGGTPSMYGRLEDLAKWSVTREGHLVRWAPYPDAAARAQVAPEDGAS